MKIRLSLQFAAVVLFTLIVVSLGSAFAAGIDAPSTNVGQRSVPVGVNDVKPPACDALFLSNIISGSGVLIGSDASELIIGSTGADTIDGLGGDDCILGGGGDDTLAGNEGNDVCLGGPGTDSFATCEVESQ